MFHFVVFYRPVTGAIHFSLRRCVFLEHQEVLLPKNCLSHFARVRKLVIGIGDEDKVGALLAQARIDDAAEQCLDISDAVTALAALDFGQHFLLNVDSVCHTVRDTLGDTKAEVARAGADVRDGIVFFDRPRLS